MKFYNRRKIIGKHPDSIKNNEYEKRKKELLERSKKVYDRAFIMDSEPIIIYKPIKNSSLTCSCKYEIGVNLEENPNVSFDEANAIPGVVKQDIDEEFGTFLEEYKDDIANNPEEPDIDELVSEILESEMKLGCGICFDSGFYKGYEIINGNRLVLDINNRNRFINYRVEDSLGNVVNRENLSTRPFSLNLMQGDSLIYSLTLPKFKNVLGFKIFDNLDDITDRFDFYINDILINNKKLINLKQFLGSNVEIKLKAKSSTSYTHFVLSGVYTDFIRANFGTENKGFDYTMITSVTSIQASLPSNTDIDVGYVLKDKHNRNWKVVNLNRNDRHNITIDVELRLIQEYETENNIF